MTLFRFKVAKTKTGHPVFCGTDVVHHSDRFSFFQCIQNMHCSSDIAEKPFIPNFDLEIRPWWVFRKIWPLPESYSLWCVDAKSVLKMICASISSKITRDCFLKTRPTYCSLSLATTPVLCNFLVGRHFTYFQLLMSILKQSKSTITIQ